MQSGHLHAELITQKTAMDSGLDFAKDNGSMLIRVGVALGAVTALLTGPTKIFDNVPQGHYGFRDRGGRLERKHTNLLTGGRKGDRYGFVGDGPHMHLPLVGGFQTIGTQDHLSSLGEFHVVGGNKRKQKIEAELEWGVVAPFDSEGNPIDSWEVEKIGKDGEVISFTMNHQDLIFNALTKALNNDELSQIVQSKAKESLRLILRQKDEPAEFMGSELLPEVRAKCGNLLLRDCGVELRNINLVDAAPTEADTIAFAYREGIDPDTDAMPGPEVVTTTVTGLHSVPLESS